MNMRIFVIIAMLLSCSFLTSCSTYSSGFGCGDARGVRCTPMEQVDLLISNGEIEKYTTKNAKKYQKNQQKPIVKALNVKTLGVKTLGGKVR